MGNISASRNVSLKAHFKNPAILKQAKAQNTLKTHQTHKKINIKNKNPQNKVNFKTIFSYDFINSFS
jgi:hypothetical protein